MKEWAAFEKHLHNTALAASGGNNGSGLDVAHWARLFLECEHSASWPAEFELLTTVFPAALPERGWYAYFAARSERLLNSPKAAFLSAAQQTFLRKQNRLLRVFSGDFAAVRTAETSQIYAKDRERLVIGVDIRPLSVPSTRKRGIGRYLVNTISCLIAQPRRHTFVLLGDAAATGDAELHELFRSERVCFRVIAENCDRDLDVFLLTDPCPMLRNRRTAELPIRRCPRMTIIYDFIPLEFPELYLQGDSILRDEYLDNLDEIASTCRTAFPISEYVGSQCKQLLGMSDDDVVPILGGVDSTFFKASAYDAKSALTDRPYFLYVGGADARKNISGLIVSFAKALPGLPRNTALVLAGEMNQKRVAEVLQQLRLERLANVVIGLGGITDDELLHLYSHALATVFVSLSEGLGLPALEAMAAGCPVVASNTTALAETVKDDGLLVDPVNHDGIAAAMIRLANDSELRQQLRDRGRARAAQWKWEDVAARLLCGIEQHVVEPPNLKFAHRPLRVAMLNRDNVWNAPGGDGRVMIQMRDAAKLHDIEVYFPSSDDQVRDADIIHAVNLTLPGPLARAAELSRTLNKPFVITTLYEDWHKYLHVSHQTYALCRAYQEHKLSYEEFRSRARSLKSDECRKPSAAADVVSRADALLACGESEAARLREDFSESAEYVRVIPFASSVPAPAEQSSIAALKQALGFEHYVLCVGRLETRKNQLMLLAALQDEDLPIVFAAGGYTPQPQYREVVLRWSRKRPVKVIERLPWELLSTVMRGAAVHALPSFYELPGLVHLEAAAAGLPVVCSPWGALTDYLPEHAVHLCEPHDAESIRVAVAAALTKPAAPALADIARSFTLEQLADRLAGLYESVAVRPKKPYVINKYEIAARTTRIHGGTYVAI